MTVRDDELREWAAEWQSGEEPPEPAAREAILRRVKRRTLGLRLLVAGESAIAVAALALLACLAHTSPYRVDAAVAAGLAVLTVAALAFSLWNRRGVWRTTAETTAALLDFSLARARHRRRGLRVGWLLLAAEVILLAPWIWLHLSAAAGGSPASAELVRAYLLLATLAGGAATALALLSRWTEREITRLQTLRHELGLGEVPSRAHGDEREAPAAK